MVSSEFCPLQLGFCWFTLGQTDQHTKTIGDPKRIRWRFHRQSFWSSIKSHDSWFLQQDPQVFGRQMDFGFPIHRTMTLWVGSVTMQIKRGTLDDFEITLRLHPIHVIILGTICIGLHLRPWANFQSYKWPESTLIIFNLKN